MKRVLTFLAIMLLPLSVWAMTPVTDSDLADVTGQAGVNINIDMTMDINIGTMAWGDSDGINSASPYNPWGFSSSDGGYIGISGFSIDDLRIKARTTDTYNSYDPNTMLKPLTIDVASGQGYDGTSDVTYVRIGLGSLQITLNELNFDVGLSNWTGFDGTFNNTLGEVTLGAIGIYINPASYVDIYAVNGMGVNMTMNFVLDRFQMNYVTWGDRDGFDSTDADNPLVQWASGTMPGYIGVNNLVIADGLSIAGTVRFDITTTVLGDVYAGTNAVGATVVQISFPRSPFSINVGQITGEIALAATNDYSSAYGTLGNFYIQQFNVTIAQGSWIHIWAH